MNVDILAIKDLLSEEKVCYQSYTGIGIEHCCESRYILLFKKFQYGTFICNYHKVIILRYIVTYLGVFRNQPKFVINEDKIIRVLSFNM
jgi:hypothetical protein